MKNFKWFLMSILIFLGMQVHCYGEVIHLEQLRWHKGIETHAYRDDLIKSLAVVQTGIAKNILGLAKVDPRIAIFDEETYINSEYLDVKNYQDYLGSMEVAGRPMFANGFPVNKYEYEQLHSDEKEVLNKLYIKDPDEKIMEGHTLAEYILDPVVRYKQSNLDELTVKRIAAAFPSGIPDVEQQNEEQSYMIAQYGGVFVLTILGYNLNIRPTGDAKKCSVYNQLVGYTKSWQWNQTFGPFNALASTILFGSEYDSVYRKLAYGCVPDVDTDETLQDFEYFKDQTAKMAEIWRGIGAYSLLQLPFYYYHLRYDYMVLKLAATTGRQTRMFAKLAHHYAFTKREEYLSETAKAYIAKTDASNIIIVYSEGHDFKKYFPDAQVAGLPVSD